MLTAMPPPAAAPWDPIGQTAFVPAKAGLTSMARTAINVSSKRMFQE
jgi:hypothetical protein